MGDLDIWYFTWKMPNGDEEKIRPHVTHFYAPEPPPTDEQMNQWSVPFVQQLNASPEHRVCRISHYAMVYGMNYLVQKIKESGIEYEYACRIRNDLYFEDENCDTQTWKTIIDQEPKAYVTLGIVWCAAGDNMASDHVGMARFDNMAKVWSFDWDDFKKTIAECWNFEAYVGRRLAENGLVNKTLGVRRYIIRRATPELDWNIR